MVRGGFWSIVYWVWSILCNLCGLQSVIGLYLLTCQIWYLNPASPDSWTLYLWFADAQQPMECHSVYRAPEHDAAIADKGPSVIQLLTCQILYWLEPCTELCTSDCCAALCHLATVSPSNQQCNAATIVQWNLWTIFLDCSIIDGAV